MNEVFQVKSPVPYYLSDENELHSRNPKTVAYGTESVSFITPKVNSTLGIEKLSISIFSQKCARKWESNYPYQLCKNYLQHVGFI